MLLEREEQSESVLGGNQSTNWVYCNGVEAALHCKRTSCCLTKTHEGEVQRSCCGGEERQAKIVDFDCKHGGERNGGGNISPRRRATNSRRTIERKPRVSKTASKAFYFRSKQVAHTSYTRFVGKRHLRRKRKRKSDNKTEVHTTYIGGVRVWQQTCLTLTSLFAIFQTLASICNYQAKRLRYRKSRAQSRQTHPQHQHHHESNDREQRIYYNDNCCDYFKTSLALFKSQYSTAKKTSRHMFIRHKQSLQQQQPQQLKIRTGSGRVGGPTIFTKLRLRTIGCCKFSYKYSWLMLLLLIYLNFSIKGK